MGTRRERGSVLDLIKSLAARPDGVGTADMVQRLGDKTNSPRLRNAARQGHIFCGKREGQKAQRWFATAEAAQAWMDAWKPPAKAEPKPRGRPPKASTAIRKDQPVATIKPRSVGAMAHGDMIITPATVFTIDSRQRPNSRIEAAPNLPPDPRWPSFSSAPLGVNPDTGRPWA